MTEFTPPVSESESPEELANLLLSLRRKEGTWVEWGNSCARLQKAGYNAQQIFEETGFEPIQQNQVIVAAQVYESMTKGGAAEATRSHYNRTGSDSLYELRILTQPQRVAVADFLVARNIDSEGAREVSKAVKDFSRYTNLPVGFTNHPGDAMAYQYWRYAKEQSSLTERSRLIARGLMFAHSQSARQQIEQLLMDTGDSPRAQAPILPVYRLEISEQIPQIFPLGGTFPLKTSELADIPFVEPTGSFGIIQSQWQGSWVCLPGWQVLLKAELPAVILCQATDLPIQSLQIPTSEELLVVIDRAQTEWDENSYLAVDRSGIVSLGWFPEPPELNIIGKLILILRPKRIIDEDVAKDVWQIDE
ncbi:RuBisCO accumulation factor 1 [Merismopedia glauca]|uniref:RuBisCO accumulation factor 1 n=1 Tax=Merismopedia glauca CCAP 1448/3 TaxID=1296344 RepID=A0A2T1C9F7_9CYAN|nr:RuBisCO accumulation factor 1 [Merismopedia glauca]PSB04900.1 hypothetical protein C7B64_02095 [Merismopedia glauca CCAP 1448/3]